MIVLPNTPPTPKPWNPQASLLSPQLLALRASIDSTAPATHSETVRYVVNLEEYLEGIFALQSTTISSQEVASYARQALETQLATSIPWNHISNGKTGSKPFGKKPEPVEWTLAAEIQTVIVATAFTYTQLGAQLTNELIELDPAEVNEKWLLVVNYYKKALALTQFGSFFSTLCSGQQLDPWTFVLLDKIGNVGIQLSILCKSSCINRGSYNESETFKSSNNGTLCRVAIWVMDEVKNCQSLVNEIASSVNEELFKLDYEHAAEYLAIFHRYVAAYAGQFLSIEYYQQGKLGHAIGLINFSLLSLQSKNKLEPKKRKVFSRFRSKLAGKRHESYIAGLQSITSLKVDKLVFLELSGVVLNDLSLLFDQLVQCHLKYTKENENLLFQSVVNWQDIHSDSKWPLGSKIPVSPVKAYVPQVLAGNSEPSHTTRQYF